MESDRDMEGLTSINQGNAPSSTELPYEHHPCLEYLKFGWSCCVVIIAIIVICTGITYQYSVIKYGPWLLFLLLIASILLLAYVEGLHYAVVSVERWDVAKYRSRFPRGYKTHSLVNSPGNHNANKIYMLSKFWLLLASSKKEILSWSPIFRHICCILSRAANIVPRMPLGFFRYA